MADELAFQLLSKKHINEIANLGIQLNPKLTVEEIRNYLNEMFEIPTYNCFGMFKDNKLIGISSAWITIRLYSGKQLEVDNVVIDKQVQSKGHGKKFFEFIESWAKKNNCKTVELNIYIQNARSHKFYFNLGYSILGLHFWKNL